MSGTELPAKYVETEAAERARFSPAELRRRDRDAARAYVLAVMAGDRARMAEKAYDLDWILGTGQGWTIALRRLAQLDVPLKGQRAFLDCWIRGGEAFCDRPIPDPVLIDALRRLLPAYDGPGRELFRGDSMDNRRHRRYGASWSADRNVADSFARSQAHFYQEGTVVLHAHAPAEAIICAAGNRHGEAEFIVDRRRLGRVRVSMGYRGHCMR